MGGSYVPSVKVHPAGEMPSLPTPNRTGYDFGGWYYDADLTKPVDKDVAPEEDCIFYAKWMQIQIAVTFVGEGSKKYIYVPYGENLTEDKMPAVPEKEGFSGKWEVKELINVTEKLTVHAVYEPRLYSVTYFADGEEYAFYKGSSGDAITYPENPEKDGYYFYGWYYDSDFNDYCGEKIENIGVTDITLYARMIDMSDMERYFTYVISDGQAVVTGLTSLGKNQRLLVIPDTLGGAPVVSVTSGSENNPVIASSRELTVAIPSSVKSIGDYAFYGADLTAVRLSEGLERIGNYAFAGCKNLVSVRIPSTVKSVGEGAFYGDSSLSSFVFEKNSAAESIGAEVFHGTAVNTFALPDNDIYTVDYRTFIGSSVRNFRGNGGKYLVEDGAVYLETADEGKYTLSLFPIARGEKFEINLSVVNIADGAFYGNAELSGVIIPSSVVSIGNEAFAYCGNLAEVQLSEGLISIGEKAFFESGIKAVEIPATVETIGLYAFSRSKSETVAFLSSGDNVLDGGIISDGIFAECENLKQVTLPTRAVKIGNRAFYNCYALNTVTFPSGSALKEIGDYAFYRCDGLKRVSVPTGVTKIGSYAFYGKEGGSEIEPTIPRGITYLGDYAFANSHVVSYNSNSNAAIEYFGEGVFQNCKYLTSVQFSRYAGFNEISPYAFGGCTSLGGNGLIFYSNITKLGEYAFYNCSLLSSVTFSESGITEIGKSCFEGCSSLKYGGGEQSILPAKLTVLGERAFYGCSNLEVISVPQLLTAIPKEAFAHCTALTEINYIEGCLVDTLGENCFAYCTSLKSARLPSKLSIRGNGAGAVKNPFYGCANLVSLSIRDNDNLTSCRDGVTEEGIIYIKNDENPSLWGIYLYPTGKVGAFTVDIAVSFIDDYAFYGTSALSSVGFAVNGWSGGAKEDVTLVDIGNYSFAESSLTSADISYRIGNIGAYAFYKSSLRTVNISDVAVLNGGERFNIINDNGEGNALKIGEYAFSGISVTELTIPRRVKVVGEGAFSDCYLLNKVIFGENYAASGSVFVEDALVISARAFANDSRLTEITIPARTDIVGAYAFENCRNMETVILCEGGDGLIVEEYAFKDNHYLYSVAFPSDLQSLGKGAFYGCTRLAEIEFEPYSAGREALAIPEYAFYGCYDLSSFVVPAYVGYIGKSAFENSRLVSVTFENAFEEGIPLTIGERAFYGSKDLKTIRLPARLTKISDEAFRQSGISDLRIIGGAQISVGAYAFAETEMPKATLTERILIDGEGVFYNAKALKTVVYRKSEITVADYTFYDSGLSEINFEGRVVSIGNNAFGNTEYLKRTVLPADGDMFIGESAFENSGINEIEFISGNIGRLEIGNRAFFGTKNFYGLNLTADEIIVGDFAFAESGLQKLSLNSTLPADIGCGITYGSVSLGEIEISDGGKYFSEDGVLYDENYSIVQYPSGKTGAVFILKEETDSVAPYAFNGNGYLTTITVPEVKNVTFGENAFDNTSSVLTLYVDETNVDYYSDLPIKVESLQKDFGGLVLKNISGDRYAVTGYTGKESELFIGGKITSGGYDFYITEIAEGAFMNNSDIVKVTLGAGLTEVKERAFAFAINLTSVNLGDNVVSVKNRAFEGCVNLTNVKYGTSLSEIGSYAFYNCKKLNALDLSPTKVAEIGSYAFAGCGLETVKLDDTLEILGNNAFENNRSLVTVRLPSSLKKINDYVFRNCERLSFLYSEAQTVPVLNSRASLAGTPDGMKILVSSYSEYKYKADSDWREYSSEIISYDDISAEEEFENYVLKVNSDGLTLVCYLGTESSVEIKTDVNGKGIITEIGEYCFGELTSSVILGDGVKRLGKNSFRNAVNLTFVYIPSSVETVGSYAFYGLTALREVFIENGNLIKIGSHAFADTNIAEITLPLKLSEIGDNAFDNADLNTVKINSAVNVRLSLGAFAFARNEKLREIVFDCAVTDIGQGAFADCFNLSAVYLNSTLSGTAAIQDGTGAFDNCDLLLVYVPTEEKLREYRRDTGWQSPYDRNRLVVSSHVSADGFVINFIGSTTDVAVISYTGTESEVNFPAEINGSTVKRIGRDENNSETVVNGCVIGSNVTSVVIPAGVTTISGDAFRGAKGLQSFSCADGSNLTEIGRYAFAYCDNLKEVRLPKSVVTVGGYAFYNCPALELFTVTERDGYDTESKINISSYAFANSGIKTVTFPKHLSVLDSYAFYGCENLSEVNFPSDGKTASIGAYCFAGTALSSVRLPESLSYVDAGAFSDCANMRSVYINRTLKEGITSYTTASANVFVGKDGSDGTGAFVKIYVPETAYESYKNAIGWNTKTVIPDLTAEAYSETGTGETFNYRINGSGAVNSSTTVTLTAYLGDSEELVVPKSLVVGRFVLNVTTIDPYFGNEKIKKVTFEKDCGVTNLNSHAFAGCTSLKQVVMSDKITGMGDYVFAGCVSLTDITLSKTISDISAYAFSDCVSLKEITVPKSATEIKNAAFLNCASLNRIIVEFDEVSALGISALVGTDPGLVIVVPKGCADKFANQWSDWSGRIYDADNKYGDFVLKESEGGFTLVQYNGNLDVLNLGEIVINGKKITAVAENALPNGTEIEY